MLKEVDKDWTPYVFQGRVVFLDISLQSFGVGTADKKEESDNARHRMIDIFEVDWRKEKIQMESILFETRMPAHMYRYIKRGGEWEARLIMK